MNLLTTTQAASVAGVDSSTLRRWCREGRIDGAVQYGRAWLIPAGAMECVTKRKPGRKSRE
jgi:excisionase family DNA binding protein